MKSDKQRLYSVLTGAEIREKMMKEIVRISEVFSLSQSDATIILIRLDWNSFKASDRLGDDKERVLAELGLLVQDSESTSSSADLEIDGDGDSLVSTPFCSHKFCSDCWRDHLSKSMEKKKNEGESVLISCLNQDCVASVGPNTIEKLAEPVKQMYERYVVGSFLESNKESIKLCPAPGCEYAIERHDEPSEDDNVVCLCGHTFCWRCQLESHRPVTCNNASLWCNDLAGQAENLDLVAERTKRCPRCLRFVQKRGDPDWRSVTCISCSHTFCWRCLRSKEEHEGINHCYKLLTPPPSKQATLIRHLALWEEYHAPTELSKGDLKAIDRTVIPYLKKTRGLGELEITALREAWMLIVQCRLVLEWSCVFGYFISDYHSAKKQYLDHLRDEANANLLNHKATLDELTRGAVYGGDTSALRLRLENTTTTAGNYFHFFVKTLEDGLCDVKVDAYEDVSTDYWFCDRCTFQNDCTEKRCRMCVAPFEPSTHVAFGNNNTTASAHQEQVPFTTSDNAVACQGGTNPFHSPPLKVFGYNSSASPTHVVSGNNNNNSSASPHQQQVANISNNPFARPGGTNLFESRPVTFGKNGSSASAQHEKVSNMPKTPLARKGCKSD